MKYSRLYFQYFLRALVISAYCILCAERSWAVACNAIFSNGIQATAPTGNINLSYQSILTGGNATLMTKTLTDNTSWVACSGSSCVASGISATTSTPTFVTGTASNGNINIAANATQNVSAGDYGNVNVGQAATFKANSNNGVYRTRAFTTSFQSVLELTPGDYWINGNLTLAQETVIKRVNNSGSVRIFVNGNITLGYKITTSGFTSNQVLIYATGSISQGATTNQEHVLNAFIYAGGDISLGFNTTVNGGISGANFTASGNQVKVNYQPASLSSANFAPFCSGTAVVPILLGSWRMDQASWNGTAGEVIDSSGQNNHGRARIAGGATPLPSTTSGFPAYTSGAQSTCRYGQFDGTASSVTRTHGYVELSGFPTLPNGFTFAAWINSSNASAQHQRILVRDDAQNGWGLSLADGTGQPKLRFFARNITNNGAVSGQGSNPGCGVFCIDTNSVLTSNAWYYVASVIDTTAKTITLYVYNASGVLQAKTSGVYAGTWTDGTGTAAIGGETSASSEGQQTSWHFLGNIDEVSIYSGALAQTSIESLLTSVRTCPAPDHYELDLAANSLACIGANVTVRACADSVSPCTNLYSINSNVTLATSAGSLNSTTLSLASGAATTKLFHPAAIEGANAVVTLSGEATAATNARKCCVGGSCSVANSCSTTFKQAGFIFSTTALGAVSAIPTQVAGPDGNAYLRALQTNTTTGACTARFTSPQTVRMAYKCVNPTTCIAGQTFKVGTTNISSNANTASPIVFTNVNLSFDVNGSAPIPINYTDVGQVELLAELPLAATTADPAYTLTGSSIFVVKPYTLFPSLTSNPSGTNAAGVAAGFVSAGTNFSVKVEARNSTGALTPNFGKEGIPETIDLNNLTLIYPSGGAATALTFGEAFLAVPPAGTFLNTKVSWNQVGSFTVQARLGDNNYLGGGDLAAITTTPTIGRIYPNHFRVVISALPNSCGSFTYMGQPMALTYTLQAESTGGITLTNYGGNYSTTVPGYVAENADSGTALSTRFKAGASPSWASGIFILTSATASFARNSLLLDPDGAFNSLRIGLSMADTFDYRNLQAMDMNATSANACGASCNAKALGSALDMRFGRLRLDDAFGPETFPLRVNFSTEYWASNHFSINANDSCTLVPRSAITYQPKGNLMTPANFTVDLAGGTTQGTYTSITPTAIGFNAGTAGQMFTAPTNAAQGGFVVSVDLTSLPWLRFDWNQDGNHSDTALPNATFTFGSYRGNDRIIYWREKLQ